MDFDELLLSAHSDDIYVALILATHDGVVIDLAHREDVALRHHAIQYLKGQRIYQVEHLFFGADEQEIVKHEGVPHVLDVESLYLASIAALKDVHLVLAVDYQDVVLAHSVHVARRLPLVGAVDHGR